jgi:hypothetical protein
MIKKLVGLALFQTSVYLLYIEPREDTAIGCRLVAKKLALPRRWRVTQERPQA